MDNYLEEINYDVNEIKRSVGSIWGSVSIILILLSLVLLNGVFSPNNKITDYGRQCQQENISVENCSSWTLYTTTYILNKSAEEVVYYDGSGDAVRENCHIGDPENWYCDAYEGTALEGNGKNVIGFAGGNWIGHSPYYADQHFGHITYLWHKILSWFRLF